MRRPRARSTLSRILYRLHPDRPKVGAELLQVQSKAKQQFFLSGQRLRIVSWNTHKGTRSGYREHLEREVLGADLILLQEFKQGQAFDSIHQTVFHDKDSLMAVSYFTLQSNLSPTGVYTASTVPHSQAVVVTSRSLEPLTKTPKMALCSWYPLHNSYDSVHSLLVLNCHGINFRLRKSFESHMSQLREQLTQHMGPIIFIGDFNTWESGRERILDSLAGELSLQQVQFPRGIKRVGSHELDRVYVRGGVCENCRVSINRHASDHSLLSFDFILA